MRLKPGAFSQKIVEMLPRDIALLVANSLGGSVSESFVKFRRSIRRKTDAGEVLKIVNIEPLSDAEADSDYLLLTIEEWLTAPVGSSLN